MQCAPSMWTRKVRPKREGAMRTIHVDKEGLH